MNHVEPMMQAHPNRARSAPLDGLANALTLITDCAETCAMCADACIAEDKTKMLMRCIRMNMDCTAICLATSAVLSRANEPDWRMVRAQLQSCLTACAACAEECERHAKTMAHCRICAEACHACERACQQLLQKMPAVAMA